jgi:hypothetical protein
MEVKQLIGCFIIFMVFAGLFYGMTKSSSYRDAIFIYVAAGSLAAVVFLAASLINGTI